MTHDKMKALVEELGTLHAQASKTPLDNRRASAKVCDPSGRCIYECRMPHPVERKADAELVIKLRNNLPDILEQLAISLQSSQSGTGRDPASQSSRSGRDRPRQPAGHP